ncbi:MAG: thiamine pyrophosphate-requiring protein [Chloroflexi bacterium]|nr:thiamine pyrophosphate-requiring protein [Chloroflexota bacterium]
MAEAQGLQGESWWTEAGAEEWSDALMASMKLGGVDNLFFVSGSEIAFYQESAAKAREREWPSPRLVTMTHEGAALNAALGNAMVTGQPAATAVHVDVGTLNYGGAIHTAWRGGYPVLITAGAGPRAFPGQMTGGRDGGIQWVQEPRDQGEIVRQYTKHDHRLEHMDNPGLMVSRLLQVAMSDPQGPVYLTVPREVAMQTMPGTTRFPTRDQLGVAKLSWPDPKDAKTAAEWLIKADNPCIYVAKSGRHPEAVDALVRLAELLALPVMETQTDKMNFPTTHPLYGTGPAAKDSDVLLVIESPAAFVPGRGSPSSDAKIIWVDVDPVQSRYKTMEHRADMWLPVSTTGAALAIYEAATGLLTKSDMSRIADRRARLEMLKQEKAKAAEDAAAVASKRKPLHPRWVAYQIGQIMEPDTILLDDALSNTPFVQAYHNRDQPRTYFKSGGSTGGWGSGAAFGAKVAKPDSDVILTSGDGYYMFGTPLAGLWAAGHHNAPYLTVVFVNGSYSTGTRGLKGTYPDGAAMRAENYDGGLFDPPPDFAKLAEAANGYGETVYEAEEVGPALRRGLEQVRNGTPAVIAAKIPTAVQEMSL